MASTRYIAELNGFNKHLPKYGAPFAKPRTRLLPKRLLLFEPFSIHGKRLLEIMHNTPSFKTFKLRDFELEPLDYDELVELRFYLKIPAHQFIRGSTVKHE